MPQRKKGDSVTLDELDKIERRIPESSSSGSQVSPISSAWETFNRDINPFYDPPYPGAGPIDRLTSGVGKVVGGIESIPSQMGGAWERFQKSRKGGDWAGMGAHLGGTVPVVGPMFEQFLTAPTTPQAVGHGAALLSTMGAAEPESVRATGRVARNVAEKVPIPKSVKEVGPITKDAARGAWQEGSAAISHPFKTSGKHPSTVVGGLTGYLAGHHYGGYPGGLAGAAVGGFIPGAVRGGYRAAKAGREMRAMGPMKFEKFEETPPLPPTQFEEFPQPPPITPEPPMTYEQFPQYRSEELPPTKYEPFGQERIPEEPITFVSQEDLTPPKPVVPDVRVQKLVEATKNIVERKKKTSKD